MLSVGSHQELVVKKMIELGADVNQTSHTGELPLSRNLASVTAETYDSDAAIFDMLIGAGSVVESKSVDDHPLLAICKVSSVEEEVWMCGLQSVNTGMTRM